MRFSEAFGVFLQANAAPTHDLHDTTAYTGTRDIHHGIALPVLRKFVQQWADENKETFTHEDWLVTVDALYGAHSLEEKEVGAMLLAVFPVYRKRLPLDHLERLLGQLEGWQEVDNTCQSVYTAKELLANWDGWQTLLRRLAVDTNINKRRAGLVLLVRPVRENGDPRLAALMCDQITTLAHERDKLITRAISWLLRSAIKHHEAVVSRYLETHGATITSATLREVRTKLNTGTKTGPA